VLQKRPSVYSQSDTLDIIPKRGIMKNSNTNVKINNISKKITKIQNVVNEFKDVSVHVTSAVRIRARNWHK